MEKTNNVLIDLWTFGAKSILEAYIILGENPTERIKDLAKEQLALLEESAPNKNKTIEQQLNDTQRECYEYLKKVAETGEL